MLIVIVQSLVMLNVTVMNVIMLSVIAPLKAAPKRIKTSLEKNKINARYDVLITRED
jgi:hypothetical protein